MGDVALVCGGGGALGGAIVATLSARGDRVVVVDRSAGESDDGVRREAVDLTSADEVSALWERLEADGWLPRWVVNAVGGFRGGPGRRLRSRLGSVRVRPEPRDRLVVLPRGGAAAEPAGGAVVNVGSRSGVEGGVGSAAYAVAKAGVIRLTEVLAADLSERRVRVNAILPSMIDTPCEP